MDDERHAEDHRWIGGERARRQEWDNQWNRVFWAVVTTLIGGAAVSFFGLLWWAFTVFVRQGGVA